MSDSPRGTFMPLHGVLPNPNEPDWEEPADLDSNQNEADLLGEQSEHSELPAADQLIAALETIRNVLGQNIETLNKKGAELFKTSNYSETQKKAEHGKLLANLHLRAEDLLRDWLLLSKEIFLDSETTKEETSNGTRKRRTPQKLVVKFSDGDRIFESSAAETFSKSIAKLGISKVESLGIKRLNHPLVSTDPPEKYQSNG